MDELFKISQEAEIKAIKKTMREKLKALENSKEKNKSLRLSKCKTSLEWFRINKGMTQSKLSEISGVNLRTLQDYEQGRKDINGVRGITLYKLAQALECTIEDLLEL